MTNLNLYRVFCEVAKTGNITKASENLFLSQPAVSSAIKELEAELGGQLFVRQNKGVALTSYGQDIYNKISSSVENLENIEHYFDDIKTLENGILRIGSNTSNTNQIISKYLVKFASIYPKVKIVMIHDERDKLIDMLRRQELDIAYLDNVESSEFAVLDTYKINYNLIAGKDLIDKYNKKIDVKAFPVSDIILPNSNNTSRRLIDEHFSKLGINLKPKYVVDNYSIIYDMVKNGLGIAFVNTDYYQDKIGSEIFLLKSDFSFLARKISAIYNKKLDNPTLIQFIDIVKD